MAKLLKIGLPIFCKLYISKYSLQIKNYILQHIGSNIDFIINTSQYIGFPIHKTPLNAFHILNANPFKAFYPLNTPAFKGFSVLLLRCEQALLKGFHRPIFSSKEKFIYLTRILGSMVESKVSQLRKYVCTGYKGKLRMAVSITAYNEV